MCRQLKNPKLKQTQQALKKPVPKKPLLLKPDLKKPNPKRPFPKCLNLFRKNPISLTRRPCSHDPL